MAELAGPVGPVAKKDRFQTLDIIRGVALFGILLMNITMFGLPFSYSDPTVYGWRGAGTFIPGSSPWGCSRAPSAACFHFCSAPGLSF